MMLCFTLKGNLCLQSRNECLAETAAHCKLELALVTQVAPAIGWEWRRAEHCSVTANAPTALSPISEKLGEFMFWNFPVLLHSVSATCFGVKIHCLSLSSGLY